MKCSILPQRILMMCGNKVLSVLLSLLLRIILRDREDTTKRERDKIHDVCCELNTVLECQSLCY